jgi:hypothetical protein
MLAVVGGGNEGDWHLACSARLGCPTGRWSCWRGHPVLGGLCTHAEAFSGWLGDGRVNFTGTGGRSAGETAGQNFQYFWKDPNYA